MSPTRTRTSFPRVRTIVLPAAVVGSVILGGSPGPAEATETARSHPGERGARTIPASATPTPETAVAASGDTVTAIAARHGRRTSDVLAANGLDARGLIYPGQVLRLDRDAPEPAPEPAAPTVAASVTHTIVAGDTITAIAKKNDVTVTAILDANDLVRDSIIYPGQTLVVPRGPVLASVVETAPPTDLDEEQFANARTIVRIGRELGIADRGIAIALGTAMQESWLRNLDGGDRDSGGLFQQRPSTGWGSAAEVRDAERATRCFFGGAGDPNDRRTRGLRDIPGWEAMSYADAAQAVQISAFPDRYARWEEPAARWLAALS